MSKITITGFINYKRPESWDTDPHGFSFHAVSMVDYGYTPVQAHSFEVEIKDDFDPRDSMLKELDKKEQALRAEFARQMMEIGKERSKLLALESA